MTALILLATLLAGLVPLATPLRHARLWRATITPLASIVGSGFLVLGPILQHGYGYMAPVVMAALCLGAFAFGGAIRYNIFARAATEARGAAETRLETLASWALAFAYVISVAYYLNLFGAFAVSLTPLAGQPYARIATTLVFLLILAAGWTRGFRALEHMEQWSVGLKLAVIAGLLAGLSLFFLRKARDGALTLDPPLLTGWPAVTLAFGLIVTVQGFETARYLGEEYDPPTRQRAMWLAQVVSTTIYMIYIGLIAFVFTPDAANLSETAIIDMMRTVAPILPVLLVAAALAAQFSAAVADTGGAGGLITELTRGRISPPSGYAALVAAGLLLTWALDIFSIIAYASRAFALYYTLQSAIAACAAHRKGDGIRMAGYGALAILGLAITLLGQPAE
mgnify:CR=1 FL=1